ncbi:MAG: hypothetical protein FMNOHCHN_03776 [Ignavibacteriaceae bacterium]|nr:hypothetical protein [Ignavibacteriaceae bacterium]
MRYLDAKKAITLIDAKTRKISERLLIGKGTAAELAHWNARLTELQLARTELLKSMIDVLEQTHFGMIIHVDTDGTRKVSSVSNKKLKSG